MSCIRTFTMSYEKGSLTCDDCNSCIENEGVMVRETYGFSPRLKMMCGKCAKYHRLEGNWYKLIIWKMSKNDKVELLKEDDLRSRIFTRRLPINPSHDKIYYRLK